MNMLPLFFAAQTKQGGESLSTVSSAFSHLPYTGQPRGSEACMGAHTHTHIHTHSHCASSKLGLCSQAVVWVRILAPHLLPP